MYMNQLINFHICIVSCPNFLRIYVSCPNFSRISLLPCLVMYIYMLFRIRQCMLKTSYKQNNKTILEIFLF